MSGGSYNYLCYKSDEELFGYGVDETLDQMVNDLAQLGYADDVAREATELLMTIRAARLRVNVIHERLSPVFRAREWWMSGDRSEEEFKKTLEEYRKETSA